MNICFFTNNQHFLEKKIDTIASNVQEILRQQTDFNARFEATLREHEASNTRREAHCQKQERMCENILSLLEKLTQTGKLNTESIQQSCETNRML